MNARSKYSLILISVFVATAQWAYGAQPPDVVASDGNGNTAMGSSALAFLTFGFGNTGSGVLALENITSGSYNTASGAYALQNNATGDYNTATGESALGGNTSGTSNTAAGESALVTNSTGSYNTAAGGSALRYNTTGNFNDANGYKALYSNSTGTKGVAVGGYALYLNTTGNYNNGLGYGALYSNTTGSNNSGIGSSALYYNATGINNSAFGNFALYSNTTGGYNNAQGYGALIHNTTGTYNASMGVYSLYTNTVGNNNVAMGQLAGYYVTGSNNIDIGNKGMGVDNGVVRIGTAGVQTATFIAGVSGVNVTGGATVVVNASGQLGVVSSSRRYKEYPLDGDVSARLLELRPVTFRYRKADENGSKPEQYGLIAEEVAKVMPELVVYNNEGQPETVAYQTLAPLLLNELQREHKVVLAQAQQLAAMKSAITEVNELRTEMLNVHRSIEQLTAAH